MLAAQQSRDAAGPGGLDRTLADYNALKGTAAGHTYTAAAAAAAGEAVGEAAGETAAAAVPEFFRAKGLFDIEGAECMYALQAVQSTYELVAGPPWAQAGGAPRGSSVTFIGRHLPPEASLRAALAACSSSTSQGAEP